MRRLAHEEEPSWDREIPQESSPQGTKPKQRTAPDPVQTEAKRQNQVEYDRQRKKSPERVEYKRLYAQKRPHRARELGKCRNCSKPAIPGQSRCETCAEQHRQSRRRSDAKRRAAAKAMPAAERQATLPLTQGSWETTKRDWPNPKSIEHARPGSQQNLSFLKGPHHD